MMHTATHALTVDVEDYFHVEAFSSRVSRDRWETYPLRVEENTRRLLDLFDERRVQATFFILGWVAWKRPALVAEVARRGHEVACHSHWHRLVYRLSPDEFRSDLLEATAAIEDAAQGKVRGFRAPSFSITRKSLWALEILAEAGYAYDSSIFPIRHDVYGFPRFPRLPVRILLGSSTDSTRGSLVEFPPSTVRVLGRNLPGPGGGYLRMFPFRYSRWALCRLSRNGEGPGTVYLHPWEIDPEQPRIPAPLKSRLRHYTSLRHMEQKLDRLLREFRFAPMASVIAGLANTPTLELSRIARL